MRAHLDTTIHSSILTLSRAGVLRTPCHRYRIGPNEALAIRDIVTANLDDLLNPWRLYWRRASEGLSGWPVPDRG